MTVIGGAVGPELARSGDFVGGGVSYAAGVTLTSIEIHGTGTAAVVIPLWWKRK